jgi:hypothetical protein
MRQAGQLILTVGVLMLAVGVTAPFVVGSALSPAMYNVLQIGGIVLAVVGWVVRQMAPRAST